MPRDRRSSLWTALVAAGAYTFVTIAFTPWYSERLLRRGPFEATFGSGVYRFRVLGRELVLLVERLVGNPLGEHLVVNGRHPHAGGMFTALFVVNGLAFVAIALLAGMLLRQARVGTLGQIAVLAVIVGTLAASASTVTPYDFLCNALLVGALVAADRRPPWDLAAVPLVVAAVLTRESGLVAAAALVAVGFTGGDRRRRTVAIAAALAGVAAYVAVRLVVGGDADLWADWSVRGNLARPIEWLGLAAMVGAYVVWRRAALLAGLVFDRTTTLRFWALASPYVAVGMLTGYWFEVRLVVPMILCEVWLSTRAAPATA